MTKRTNLFSLMFAVLAVGFLGRSAYCAPQLGVPGSTIQNILFKGYLSVEGSTGPVSGSGAPATVEGSISDGPSFFDSYLWLAARSSFSEVVSSSHSVFVPITIQVPRVNVFEQPMYGKNRVLIEKRYIAIGLPVDVQINNGPNFKVKGSLVYSMNEGKGTVTFVIGTKRFSLQIDGKKAEMIFFPLKK